MSEVDTLSGDNSTVYTPTTDEVRLDYAPAKTFPADAEEQFDRWLAEVKADAWEEGWTHNVGDSSWNSLYDNPHRQGEGSGDSSSQSPVESSNLLNGEEQ